MTNPVLQLDAEWPQILPELRRAFPSWRDSQPILRRFRTLDDLRRFVRERSDVEELDPVLRALLAIARTDSRAARLVLEALTPGLKLRSQRLLATDRVEHDELWELLLDHTWQVIRRTELAPESRNVAVSLLFDVLDLTLAELERRDLYLDEVGPGVLPERAARILGHDRRPDSYLIDAPDAADEPDQRLADRDAWEPQLAAGVASGAISDADAFLIEATRVDGVSLAALSIHLGVPRHALKMRRLRAEGRLRPLADLQGDVPATPRNSVRISAGASRDGAQIHRLELARPLPDQAA